jgi:hypothetical protein
MNFITRKHLSRRTFLRGAGVTMALPSVPPLQLTGLTCEAVQVKPAGWLIVTEQEVVQPKERRGQRAPVLRLVRVLRP